MRKGNIIRFIKDGIPFGNLNVVTKTYRKNLFCQELLTENANTAQGERYIAQRHAVKVDIYTVKIDAASYDMLKGQVPPAMLNFKYGVSWDNIIKKVKKSKNSPFAIKLISPKHKSQIYVYADHIDKLMFKNNKNVLKQYIRLSNVRLCSLNLIRAPLSPLWGS